MGTQPGATASTLRASGGGGPIPVQDEWRVSTLEDEALNDNDKSFTVPASTEYQILGIRVEFTSDGNAGDRQLVVEVQNAAADVIATWAVAGTVQGATLTYIYEFAPGLSDLAGVRDTSFLSTPIPVTSFLAATHVLRIYENNNVAAGDDMDIQILIASRTV